MMTPTHAITVHRPWAYAIARLGKNIENRTWACWLKPGSYIAIHAGLSYDRISEHWIRRTFPHAHIPPKEDHPTGIVAVVRFDGNVTNSESPWFVGSIGWKLSGAIALPKPVACPGHQKLWAIDDDTRNRLAIALEASKVL